MKKFSVDLSRIITSRPKKGSPKTVFVNNNAKRVLKYSLCFFCHWKPREINKPLAEAKFTFDVPIHEYLHIVITKYGGNGDFLVLLVQFIRLGEMLG